MQFFRRRQEIIRIKFKMFSFVQRINLIAALLVALNARLCFCGINLGINSLIHYIENIDRSVIF